MRAEQIGLTVTLASALLLSILPTMAGEDDSVAPKGSLSVVGVQAETGLRLPTVYFTLIDRDGRVIGRNCENCYAGDAPVAAGTEIRLFAPGHDARRLVLRESQLRSIEVQLSRTQAELHLVSEVGPGIADRLYADVVHYVPDPEGGDVSLLLHRREMRVDRSGTRVAVPQGLRTVVYPHGDITDHVWPLAIVPQGGETIAIRADRMRSLPIRRPEEGGDPGLVGARVFPSYALPAGWPPARVDALLRRLWGGLRVLRRWREGDHVVNQVPPIDFHLLARVRGEPVYRFVRVGAAEIDLRRWEKPVSIQSVSVAGRPPPSGTAVAPGRLGHDGVARLATLGHEHLLLVDEASTDEKLLAAADAYTIWCPIRGLAYASVQDSVLVAGDWEAGTIELRSRTGASFSGRCAIWQTLVGTGAVGSQPPSVLRWDHRKERRSGFVDVVWERESRNVDSLRFVGVPAGDYRMHLDVVIPRTGETYRAVNSMSCPLVRVTPDDAHPVVFFD